MNTRVSIDAAGGDHGLSVTVPGALAALARHDDLAVCLVGDKVQLEAAIASSQPSVASGDRLSVRHASQTVDMDEPPAHAMRNKKDSSMRVALDLVGDGDADACVSAGNTGALLATARFVLRTLPGIDRPAILSALPNQTGHTHVLDLGANVDASPEQLYEFAVMGSVVAEAVDGIASPRIGLLNIGEEAIKGNERVKHAAELLRSSSLNASGDLNYIGFVEGNDLFSGEVDVVVCDGFVGNVALKATEGAAKMISRFLREEFTRSPRRKLGALVARPALRALAARIDPREYNGASLIGLNKIVVKSHGGADEVAFSNAVSTALAEARRNVPGRIRDQIARHLSDDEVLPDTLSSAAASS